MISEALRKYQLKHQGQDVIEEAPLSPTKLDAHEIEAVNLFGMFKQIQGEVGGSKMKSEWVTNKMREILEHLADNTGVAKGKTKGRKRGNEPRKKDFLESNLSVSLSH